MFVRCDPDWINLENVVLVKEIRNSPPREAVVLEVHFKGNQAPRQVNDSVSGKGAVEKVLAWLESQSITKGCKLPEKPKSEAA